jgi:hypothetical protein
MDGADMKILEETLFGYPIRAEAQRLDDGLHVLLTGGCRTHIGAVSLAQPGQEPETRFFPGHKDQFLSQPWAKALAEKTEQTVCVVCGIHYDQATKEQIAQIVEVTDRMLEELLQSL